MLGKKLVKIIKIEGMHCEHCAKKVENTLEKVAGVSKVTINLKKKEAVVSMNQPVSNNQIRKEIENLEYQVLEIKDKE